MFFFFCSVHVCHGNFDDNFGVWIAIDSTNLKKMAFWTISIAETIILMEKLHIFVLNHRSPSFTKTYVCINLFIVHEKGADFCETVYFKWIFWLFLKTELQFDHKGIEKFDWVTRIFWQILWAVQLGANSKFKLAPNFMLDIWSSVFSQIIYTVSMYEIKQKMANAIAFKFKIQVEMNHICNTRKIDRSFDFWLSKSLTSLSLHRICSLLAINSTNHENW